ncbi:hypothetical protein Taro_009217 [Colocasia esculenta]|uniref:Transposase (putative) gypsy type domain-containing protein n=1 Tax=Colocasia esculenta TaxID=4460 RepID=A0A843U452_COLES|nr:hypothetical protein [Colocasia esculenta]
MSITFRQGIRIAYGTTIRNWHSETVNRTLVSRNSVSWPKFHRGACVLVQRLSYPLGNMQIFVRAVIGTASESPFRNQHFDPIETKSDSKISGLAPKFLFGSVVAGCRCDRIRTPRRQSPLIASGDKTSDVSLEHVNPWRSNHTESACDDDLKSCSSRIAYKTTIQNRHSEAPVTTYCLSDVSLDHANPWRGNHTESACDGDRKSCSTRDVSLDHTNHWRSNHTESACDGDLKSCSSRLTGLDPYLRNAIKLPKNLESRRNPRNVPRTPRSNPSFPARSAATTRTTAFPRAPADRQNSRRSSRVKVGEEEGRERGKNRARVCHNNTDMPGKELGITFRQGIGIAYGTTIRNRHSETVDKTLSHRIPFRCRNSTAERVRLRSSIPLPSHTKCDISGDVSGVLGEGGVSSGAGQGGRARARAGEMGRAKAIKLEEILHLTVMAQKGKEIAGTSGTPPVKTKAVKLWSFEGLRERFRIGERYDIVLMREHESYLTTRPGCFVLSLDLLEAGLRLPMPEIAKELLRSWKVAPIQLTPNSWRSIFIFCIICKKRGIEATAEIFLSHFSLAWSPQSGMGIVYVKHRTNRMRINFSPRLSNNKGWKGRLFFVGRRKGANVPEWDFPVRVVEPLRKAGMAPFLIQGAAAASQSLNTVGVNHAEGYLTEYKLVKYKLSRAWDDDEVAAGRGQKEMAKYAETIPVSLHLIRLDEDAPVKESRAVSSEVRPPRMGPTKKAKTAAGEGAMKKASEKAVIPTVFSDSPSFSQDECLLLMIAPALPSKPLDCNLMPSAFFVIFCELAEEAHM